MNNINYNLEKFPLNRWLKASQRKTFVRSDYSVLSRSLRNSAIRGRSHDLSVCFQPQNITQKVEVTSVSFVSQIPLVTSVTKSQDLMASNGKLLSSPTFTHQLKEKPFDGRPNFLGLKPSKGSFGFSVIGNFLPYYYSKWYNHVK